MTCLPAFVQLCPLASPRHSSLWLYSIVHVTQIGHMVPQRLLQHTHPVGRALYCTVCAYIPWALAVQPALPPSPPSPSILGSPQPLVFRSGAVAAVLHRKKHVCLWACQPLPLPAG